MRQLKEYVGGTQTHEERHATEHHLNDCSLCSEAVEGLFARKGEAANLNAAVNSNFLKQHINATHPQDHAPASHPVRAAQRRTRFARSEGGSPMAFAPLVSAIFILCGYVLWQKTQPVEVRGNAAHTAAPAPKPSRVADPTPEAVVIPVRHKAEKPKPIEPEVVSIPAAAKVEVEAMRKAQATSSEVKPLPTPVSLRPAVVTEMPKRNVMTVVTGESAAVTNKALKPVSLRPAVVAEMPRKNVTSPVVVASGDAAEVGKPAIVNMRKPDENKAPKKPELQAFKTDGHAANKPDVQALNKPNVPTTIKPEGRTVVRPEQYPSNKPEVPMINKSDAQALNLPKTQPAPPKQTEAAGQAPRPGADQFESREAAMTAARNLQKLGKEDEARQILNDLAGSSGAQKRAARKMLRKMNSVPENNGQENSIENNGQE